MLRLMESVTLWSVMLYMRKTVGVRFLVRALVLGPGVDNPTSLDSVMAVKMRH